MSRSERVTGLALGVILGIFLGLLESALVGGGVWFLFPSLRAMALLSVFVVAQDTALTSLLVSLLTAILGLRRGWPLSVGLGLFVVGAGQALGNYRGRLEIGGSLLPALVAVALVALLAAFVSRRLPAVLPRPGGVRRGFLLLAILPLLVAFVPFDRLSRPTATGPNVLLVIVDTLRADALEPYGTGQVWTPVLSALARRGAVFEKTVTASNSTPCAIASILSSKSVSAHGVKGFHFLLPKETRTLATQFHQAGYRTFAFSSSFPAQFGYHQFDRGLDYWDDTAIPPLCALCPPVEGLERIAALRLLEAAGVRVLPRTRVPSTREADLTTGAVLSFLARDGATPFLGVVHYFDPHAPYSPPAMYVDYPPGIPGLGQGNLDRMLAEAHEEKPVWLQRPIDVKDPSFPVAAYRGEVAFVDHEIGRLLAFLAKRGELKSTVVAVMADHGESLGEHGMYFHHDSVYENTATVPLILAGPGIPAGVVAPAMVRSIDVMPTLCALASIAVPDGAQGRSLRPALERRPSAPVVALTESSHDWVQALHAGRWKLMRNAYATPERLMLFDLEADPAEVHDLSATRPEALAELDGIRRQLMGVGSVAPSRMATPEDLDRLEGLGYLDHPRQSGEAPR